MLKSFEKFLNGVCLICSYLLQEERNMTVDSYLHIVYLIHLETQCYIVTIATAQLSTQYLHSRTYTVPWQTHSQYRFQSLI